MKSHELNEDEAKTAALALIHFNNYLVGEYEKIASSEGVSDLIVNAARNQYNEISEKVTKLHLALADTFPVLRQPAGPVRTAD